MSNNEEIKKPIPPPGKIIKESKDPLKIKKENDKQREKEEKERKEKELLNSIKPCPFCGEDPTVVYGLFGNRSIECKSPMCVMGCVVTEYEKLEDVVKIWNKRSG